MAPPQPLHFHGVVLGPSGFAAEGREWLACLEHAGFAPSLAGARLGPGEASLAAPDAESIRRCAGRARQSGGIDWHHLLIPHFLPLPGAAHTVLQTVFETETLPAALAERADCADRVVVLSEWNRRGFAAGGVPEHKLRVIPPPFDAARFTPVETEPARDAPFRWLSVFDWTLRKGPDLLLAAFARAFTRGEAELILKTVPHPGRACGALQRQAQALVHAAARAAPPDVTVLECALDDTQRVALYAACDAFVLASRGEAWGRPVHEAMLMQKPVVVTSAHALATLVPDDTVGYPVAARCVPVSAAAAAETPLFAGQRWHEVDVDALAQRMREVVSDRRQANLRAQRGRAHVLALCDQALIRSHVLDLLSAQQLSQA